MYGPFRDDILELLKRCHEQGLWVYPCNGYRSFEEQDALYNKKDGTTNAKGGESFHNYGLAVDLAFDKDPTKAGVQWSWDKGNPWAKVADIALSLGFIWGGNFKTLSGDLGHFHKSYGKSLESLKQLYMQGGLCHVWKNLKEQ